MTTIAWDGTTLAADACSWSGQARRRVLKVHRITHYDRGELLVGMCGTASYAQQILQGMKPGGFRPEPLNRFDRADLDSICVVAIDRDRRIWEIGRDLVWLEILEPFYATGAGHEFAWGALEMGATAVQAVEIAAKRSDMAGLGVDTVSFQ